MEGEKTFKELYELPCEGKVEKKDCGKGRYLSYLSWAYAWATLIEQDPDANYKVYERPDGRIYWDDGNTAWVKVSVTMFGKEVIEYLAIMDDTRANASMPLKSYTYKNKYGEEKTAEAVTTFDAIKAIQRALVKAISRFGIGLKLYAGEDLPTKDDVPQAEEPKPIPQVIGTFQSKLKKQMEGLSMENSLSLIKWSQAKYGKAPNDLTDAKQQAELLMKIVAAKYKRDQPIDDDNMLF